MKVFTIRFSQFKMLHHQEEKEKKEKKEEHNNVPDSVLKALWKRDANNHQASFNMMMKNWLPSVLKEQLSEIKVADDFLIEFKEFSVDEPSVSDRHGFLEPYSSIEDALNGRQTLVSMVRGVMKHTKGDRVQYHRGVPLFKLPVMVGSELLPEKTDWDGCFIVNGAPKTFILTEVRKPNSIVVIGSKKTTFAECRSLHPDKMRSSSTCSVSFERNCLFVSIPSFRQNLPLEWARRLLGIQQTIIEGIYEHSTTKWKKDGRFNNLVKDLNCGFNCKTKDLLRWGSVVQKNPSLSEFLPHCQTKDEKWRFLMLMSSKVLSVVSKVEKPSDLVDWKHKIIKLPGYWIAETVRQLLRMWIKSFLKHLKLALSKDPHRDHNPVDYMDNHQVTQGLKSRLSIGQFGSQTGVVQIWDRNRNQFNVLLKPMNRDNRSMGQRKPHKRYFSLFFSLLLYINFFTFYSAMSVIDVLWLQLRVKQAD